MICVLLANGFEEIEALAYTDILRRAGLDAITVSVYNTEICKGSHNITILADKRIDEIEYKQVEAVILPGGLPGAYNLRDNSDTVELLKHCKNNNKLIGAICASPYIVLEQLELVNGVKITVNPAFYNDIKFAQLLKERVVYDKNILTSQGPGTTHEFAAKTISILKPDYNPDDLIQEMLYK